MTLKTKKVFLAFFSAVFAANANWSHAQSAGGIRFWQYQCIDTVKYSRDTARNWSGKISQLNRLIEAQMPLIKNSGANCVAIDTPYDAEFIPFLSDWVLAARNAGLTVWFRGNLSGWEGWFGYPLLQSSQQHNTGIYNFITQNPQLFANGDLFTPAPEPENGILENPYDSAFAAEQFREFLRSSYANCRAAFAQIHKQVSCGLFSVDGNIAKDILNAQTVKNTGNLVTIDHYVSSPTQFGSDILNLHNEFGAPLFVGEFGAPIPDINGSFTESQQAQFIDRELNELYQSKSYVFGVNYWVLAGGSTALVNDDGSPREAYQIIKDYYDPGKISGTAYDSAGDRLANVTVSSGNGTNFTFTDAQGNFSLLVPANRQMSLTASLKGYSQVTRQASVVSGNIQLLNFSMTPDNPSLFYRLKIFFGQLEGKFFKGFDFRSLK